jgi:hypothetical protein
MRRPQRQAARIGSIIPFHRPAGGQADGDATGPPTSPSRAPSSPLQQVTTGPRLLDRVKAAIQMRHMSARTEEAYVGWIRRFIIFHGKRHPDDMAEPEVESGYDIRTIQELLGHKDVATTMIYTHVVNRGPLGVQSPLDRPP